MEENKTKMELFNCEKCKICCNFEREQIIPLTDKERKFFRSNKLKLKGKCKYLKNGCTLGINKPIVCKMFPLIFNGKDFDVFNGCPLAENFKKEIIVDSPEFKHLIYCLDLTANLTKQEKKRISKLYDKKVS